MKVLQAASIAVIALLGTTLVDAKRHYHVNQKISKDHPIVQGDAVTSSQCMFEYENGDKFC
jgi:hypothetical protein